MDKEQILSTISEKIGQIGLSQRTIAAYVESHMPSEGTEPDEAYFAKAESFLKSIAGQYSHDVAEKVNEFKKNYKPDQNEGQGNNKDLDFLKSEFEKLKEELLKAKQVSSADKMRQEVLGKKGELKVRNANLWDDAVEMVKITNESTVDSVFASAKEIYESKMKRYYGDGAKPYTNTEGGGPNEADVNKKLREAYQKQLRDEGKIV
jgi:hypothetical protein